MLTLSLSLKFINLRGINPFELKSRVQYIFATFVSISRSTSFTSYFLFLTVLVPLKHRRVYLIIENDIFALIHEINNNNNNNSNDNNNNTTNNINNAIILIIKNNAIILIILLIIIIIVLFLKKAIEPLLP